MIAVTRDAELPELVTLLPSTDVDLSRWLLQLWGVPYRERPHAPVFHILALRRMGQATPKFPLFVDGARQIAGIEDLVAAFDADAPSGTRLLPDAATEPGLLAEVDKIQAEARWHMGDGVVHWAYFHFLQHRSLVWPSFTTGIPAWEMAALRVLYPQVRKKMVSALGLSAADASASLDRIRAYWDTIDARLADGRSYLVGGRLTLADLAFATSGAPMVLARGYGGHLPLPEHCPENMQAVFAECRSRPSGHFIQRLYDAHRTAAG